MRKLKILSTSLQLWLELWLQIVQIHTAYGGLGHIYCGLISKSYGDILLSMRKFEIRKTLTHNFFQSLPVYRFLYVHVIKCRSLPMPSRISRHSLEVS